VTLNVVLKDKDILQVDATIIIGVLVLLTLSNIAGNTTDIQFLVVLVAYALIILFGISAIVVIYLNLIGHGPSDKIIRFRLFCMVDGFLNLILIFNVFFLPHLFRIRL
jgi:hypothetical protein